MEDLMFKREGKIDFEQVYNNIVSSISHYLTDNGLKAMVLGVSGGIDSTVVAALCRIVSNETHIPLIGISLHTGTNKEGETSAASVVGREFCDEFTEIPMEPCYETVSAFCKCLSVNDETTKIAEGNIKARLRMIGLYHVASLRHGIVMDTDNLTESALGFFTLNGDQGDLSPIAMLWKTEVYELAKWMQDNVFHSSKGLEMAIALEPTDGNGVSSNDLEQIAPTMTFEHVDNTLFKLLTLDNEARAKAARDILEGVESEDTERFGKDVMASLVARHVNSEFKRWHRPFKVDIYNCGILDGHNARYAPFKEEINKLSKGE